MQIPNNFNIIRSNNYGLKNRTNYTNLAPLSKDTVSFKHNEQAKSYNIKNRLVQSQSEIKFITDIDELNKKYNNGDLTPQSVYEIIEDMYKQYRHVCEYAVKYESDTYDEDFLNLCIYMLICRPRQIPIRHQQSWIFRFSPTHSDNDIKERMSLNVSPNGDMLKKLDEFMSKGIYTDKDNNEKNINPIPFYYKIPDDKEQWGNRQDPVTLYFTDKIDDDTLNAIRDITAPYQRGILNHSEEAKDYNWMLIEKSPTDEEIDKLYERIENSNEVVAQAIHDNFEKHTFTSAGLFKVVSTMLDELDILKANK